MPRRLAAAAALITVVSVVVAWTAAHTFGTGAALFGTVAALGSASAAMGFGAGSRTSRTVDALMRRDRAVAVAASHELRTPITALRLSLEDLTLWPSTPADVSAELQRAISELDRLSAAVTSLLDSHRQDQMDGLELVDVAALTTRAVDAWRPRLAPGRAVHLDGGSPTFVRLDPSSVTQLVATVLGQFAQDDCGDITVEVATVGETVRVRVADQTAPRFAPGVIHGSPNGKTSSCELTLHEAGAAAEALGGYLGVADTPTTCLALILPAESSGLER